MRGDSIPKPDVDAAAAVLDAWLVKTGRKRAPGKPRPKRRSAEPSSRKSSLRLEVEAAGVDWEVYSCRVRRGATHEQAMAGDRRRVPRCPTCGGRIGRGQT
jgi:hypothetical protein